MASNRNLETRLHQALCSLPSKFGNQYTLAAEQYLYYVLFRALTNDRDDYLHDLFPAGLPEQSEDLSTYNLSKAQGAFEETEYTEAARGHLCGHILRLGEPIYRCTTCTTDPTVVLCARCYAASHHEGHNVEISVSSGNGGSCDCGDEEAWTPPMQCAIHSAHEEANSAVILENPLPEDLVQALKITIAVVLDYFCDVVSCSPENLRLPKTEESIHKDEEKSRLSAQAYGMDDEIETNPEFTLCMWNDEKHTMEEVVDQCTRACRQRKSFGQQKGREAHEIGRTVVSHSRNLEDLLKKAKIIEEIKITTTIRSARDTFREQMCGTILEWLNDIAGCSIMQNGSVLRECICEGMLSLWQIGSTAVNAKLGRGGLDDHGLYDLTHDPRLRYYPDAVQIILEANQRVGLEEEVTEDITFENEEDDDLDENDDDNLDDDEDDYEQVDAEDTTIVRPRRTNRLQIDILSDGDEMDTDDNDFIENNEQMDVENTIPEPPPPPPLIRNVPNVGVNAGELIRPDTGTIEAVANLNFHNIPRTPAHSLPRVKRRVAPADSTHWKARAEVKGKISEGQVWEDLRANIRLDSMILFDLRLWKNLRIALRELLMNTVNKIPQFKRLLGLRFAGLYPALAQ
ncbi:E3 ubiquitin-protein ligase ubr1, partial [Elasticomyces elasticus]